MASRPQPPSRISGQKGSLGLQQEPQSPQDAQLAAHLAASTSESSNPAFVSNNSQTSASPLASQATELTPAPPPAPEPEVPTCWICQMDATDDTPENSVWRRPCPCSLTAHDECLLEWITSQEAPKPGEMATTQKLVCPVCQAPIKVERPWDPLVAAADFVQRCTKTLMWPAGLSALAGCFYSGFLVYGVNALYLVFGQAEARRLLMPSPQDLNARAMIQDSAFLRAIIKFMKISDPFLPTMPGVKLFLGLPMILPALVLSRTRLADQIFAILPISYFVFNPTRTLNLREWPPSPALTLAVLPYIRTTYNELYKHTFSDLEKQWDKAVQRKPREGETAEQIEAEQRGQRDQGGFFDIEVELVEEGEMVPEDVEQANNGGNALAAEGGGLARLQADLQRHEALNVEDEAPAREMADFLRNAANDRAAGHEPPGGLGNERDIAEFLRRIQRLLPPDQRREIADLLQQERPDINALRHQLQEVENAFREAGEPALAADAGAAPGRRGRDNAWINRRRREIHRNLDVSTSQIASTVMGALFFPAISSVMGDLLKLTLPAKWVTKQPPRWGVKVSGGLLKEKWGRSIIGGCLFVVLKDAVTLYCKWKKARDFGKKRVLDYVGERRGVTAQ